MAFRQPTFAPTSRLATAQEPEKTITNPEFSHLQKDSLESQQWILFPSRQTTRTQTTSTEHTPRTAGLSRLSDFGSKSVQTRDDDGVLCEATNGSVEDDEELDSLDDGLHAFQEPGLFQRPEFVNQSSSILPRHDGLGMFQESTTPVQEQLWHFEQHNPKKRSASGHHRRRSSIQRRLDAVEDNDATNIEGERRERIEKWRMEQSKILLDKIEKETRRRRLSTTSRKAESSSNTANSERVMKDSIHTHEAEDQEPKQSMDGLDPGSSEDESIWQRITRRVIRDFIGIDDAMLSVIFGESLPEELSAAVNPSSGISSSKSIKLDPSLTTSDASWERRLIDRIARELGLLVRRFPDQPTALSRPFHPSIPDYAGIPVTVPTSSKSQKQRPSTSTRANTSPTSFHFNPTLQDPPFTPQNATPESTHAALWGIEEEPTPHPDQVDHDYWEQPADLKTVFRYLQSRFSARHKPPPSTSSRPLPRENVATTTTPDSLRRTAMIRQHHPVISRTWEHRHANRRHGSLLRRRSGSSCASSVVVGSARRMGMRGGGGSLGSSSRNYWDIGVGSGIGSGGAASGMGVAGLGAWGEI
ncbi:hypothetical protein ACLMJK_008150 [Lecanora helva]